MKRHLIRLTDVPEGERNYLTLVNDGLYTAPFPCYKNRAYAFTDEMLNNEHVVNYLKKVNHELIEVEVDF